MGVTIIVKQGARERDRQLQSTQAPHNMRGQLTDVIRTKQEALDLAHRVGFRGAKPSRPVLVESAGGRAVVVGDGTATVEELSDIAVEHFEKQEATRKRTGSSVDFDALRERAGQMRREDVGPEMRKAMAARVARGKANARTDIAQHVTAAQRKGKQR